MRSHFKGEIPFVKYRKVLFAISAICIVLSIVGLCFRAATTGSALNFGIEFMGGTQVTFDDTKDIDISQMRSALRAEGIEDAVVQTTVSGDTNGFLVRTSETDPSVANLHATQVAESLGLEIGSYHIQTIGPNWGSDVTRSMIIAFLVVIVLIIIFVSWRYEFKMSLMGIVSLIQVLLIVAGIYAWTWFEVTPNVVAALLTIMGYCLYDTVVVFNRVDENIRTLDDGVHRTALQITNYSENQVIIRSINTALTSLVPVLAMLLFGGDTLKGFAFAMVVGLTLGAYSSIAIAAPLYAIWKTREAKWREAEEKFGENAVQTKVLPASEASAAQIQTEASKNVSSSAARNVNTTSQADEVKKKKPKKNKVR
ncbi:MAG: protein translocase subunit SecF [Coriobacteriales bacterium]|nr:protein translocase subunit SecF [Coriobacteriales bacterium]